MYARVLPSSPPRAALLAFLVTTLCLVGGPVPALADPTDSHGSHDEHNEDHPSDDTPFVVDSPAEMPGDNLVEPGAAEGIAPDLGDLPSEWTKDLPAETIDPTDWTDSSRTGDLGADAVSVPAPPTKWLPSTLDAAAGWQYSYSCDPNDKPGMVAFAKLVSAHYNRPRYTTSRRCKAGNASQHGEGRAFDWPMNAYDSRDKAIGDAVAYWLTSNNGEMARRFGVQSVIWNKRSWYMYSPGSWRTYTGPSPHTDHLHISFTWDGSMKRTSWWDGTPVRTVDHGTCRVYSGQYAPRYKGRNTTPCARSLPNPPRSPYPVTLPGAKNNNVTVAQRYLGFTGSDVDGSFGPATLSALLKYQSRHRLPWTGVLDNATWAHMVASGTPTTSTSSTVSRLEGNDRYGTAASVAAKYSSGGRVYVTTGENYPDALAAGAAAGTNDNPVLLTRKDSLPNSTRQQLDRIKPWRIYVVGGKGAINYKTYRSLRAYAGGGGVIRLSGSDRYSTAAALSERFGSKVPAAYIATGANFPNALVGGARAGYQNSPMLLTKAGSLPAATKRALRRLNPGRITIVGNSSAVSSSVVAELRAYTSGSVYRVDGEHGRAVAANLARFYPRGVSVAYLATSADYPDALTGAARAGMKGGPVLLTKKDQVTPATRDALAYLKPDRIVILGGTRAVSTAVERRVAEYTQ